jgi:hypothetical protein
MTGAGHRDLDQIAAESLVVPTDPVGGHPESVGFMRISQPLECDWKDWAVRIPMRQGHELEPVTTP